MDTIKSASKRATDPAIIGNYDNQLLVRSVADVRRTLGPYLSANNPAAGAKKKMQNMAKEPCYSDEYMSACLSCYVKHRLYPGLLASQDIWNSERSRSMTEV